MYKHILVAIENSEADKAIVDHVARLAALTNARLLLVHVADGWAARHFNELNLRESEEMQADRAYLEAVRNSLTDRGLTVDTRLALGNPADQLAAVAEESGVDLIAMATHGHRFLADVVKGTTADRVRHLVKVPVLLVRA